ncbi:hypothetical protein HD553DRAFT_310095 [Filobasidium floriforme]|uniref:uncharacterized protein n=1 Tax=Filobasidium floriforme TaxID=5210 RepID=UPI001E8E3BBA|nr:uncharacterized protein HD553DRAFT_310095 [Filobasidium floriforme]KAH8085718.1 hypothetical protein HD553DRAFT_310095 [Filobasidium floriforme]
MLALRLADGAARSRRERGGIICPWEVEGMDDDLKGGLTALTGSGQEAGNAEEQAGRSELAVRDAEPNDPSGVSQTGSLENSEEKLFPERVHAVIFPQTDRPLRTGRRRETGFPGPVTAQTISHTIDQLIAQERTVAGQGYFHTPQELLGLPEATKKPTGSWGFEEALVKRFPALRKRNFACVQEHQATSYHFDLRLQIDGGTFSWAVPKGFIDLKPGSWHYAVQTPVHPISYTVHEGSDGRVFKNGTRCGTLLWDICLYSIGSPNIDREQSPESDREESDELGKFEEDKLRHALYGRLPRAKKSRYIKLVLKNGRKFTYHSFTIFQTDATYDSRGNPKKQWIIKLGHGITEPHQYPKDAMKSVKTGRLLEQVTAAGPHYWVPRPDEQLTNVEEGDLGDLQ